MPTKLSVNVASGIIAAILLGYYGLKSAKGKGAGGVVGMFVLVLAAVMILNRSGQISSTTEQWSKDLQSKL